MCRGKPRPQVESRQRESDGACTSCESKWGHGHILPDPALSGARELAHGVPPQKGLDSASRNGPQEETYVG
jgi:hypothetical protein